MLESIEIKLEKFQSITFFPLIIMMIVGAILRIYFTPWHLPSNSPDAFVFMIEGLAYANGDFSNASNRFLWPGFLSLFFVFFRFDDYIGYTTVMRAVSICVSVSTIPVLYLVANHFVEKRYALMTTTFFIVEPNLIENSIFAITEPLFILLGLLSFYFVIHKTEKYLPLAFLFAGLSFDTRLNGIVLFLLLLFVCIIKIRPIRRLRMIFPIGIGIFILVSSPHIFIPLSQDNMPLNQFGLAINTLSHGSTSVSTYDPSSNHSSFDVLKNALKNEFLHIFRISVPYLAIFFPFGLVMALKNLDYQNKILLAVIIISLIIALPQYTVSNEYRNLFFIIPFLCILSTIGLQKFTLNIEMKNMFLVILFAGLILLSVNFLRERYDIDDDIIIEKDNLGKYIANNLKGKVMGHLFLETIRNIPNVKTGTYFSNQEISVINPDIRIDTVQKLMDYSIQHKIEFLVIEDTLDEKHFPIFEDVFYNEKNFPFLEKIFDSEGKGYKKVKAKIFKIDYVKYLNSSTG